MAYCFSLSTPTGIKFFLGNPTMLLLLCKLAFKLSTWFQFPVPNFLNVFSNQKCLDHDIAGVNTSYLCAGTWLSTFGFHVEDMNLGSINTNFFGEP